MPEFRCPGNIRTLSPKPLERTCLQCGRTVEIWSDEEKAACKCGTLIFRNRQLTCVEWCPAAEKCVGDLVDVKKIKAEARERVGKEENPDFVKHLMDLIRERLAKCKRPDAPNGGKVKPGAAKC